MRLATPRAVTRRPIGRCLSEALPAGRVGEVSDIAQTFLYLMRNGYSSGTIVTVDGGSVLV
jgi:NAD(P)-dependent dehydrogenase (short-subunit alcohol dehydrogenase family)